jgi:hypothetical protein
MKMRFSSAVLLVLGVSWTVLAQGSSPMREGMWEVSSKMVMPGMEMPPMKQQQCVTAAMIKDPQSAIPKMDNDCKISNYKLEGNTATYTMTCTQPAPITATGEIKYSGSDAYTGTVKLDGMGQTLTMNIDAKRVGECPK